jgi:hypothetical protein
MKHRLLALGKGALDLGRGVAPRPWAFGERQA